MQLWKKLIRAAWSYWAQLLVWRLNRATAQRDRIKVQRDKWQQRFDQAQLRCDWLNERLRLVLEKAYDPEELRRARAQVAAERRRLQWR